MDTANKTNTFNEEGRLLQVEFAIKNVSKAGTIIGYVCTDGVVLIGINQEETNGQLEKIYQLSENVYCAVSGLFSDAMRLKRYAQVKAQETIELYDTECPIKVLCRKIGEEKQRFTHYRGSRPFGVSLLYCGADSNGYVLMSTDPSGSINQWKGMCFGENEDAINNGMRNDLPDEPVDMVTGTKEILKILSKVRECGPKEADKFEILHFTLENKKFLARDEILELLKNSKAETNQ